MSGNLALTLDLNLNLNLKIRGLSGTGSRTGIKYLEINGLEPVGANGFDGGPYLIRAERALFEG